MPRSMITMAATATSSWWALAQPIHFSMPFFSWANGLIFPQLVVMKSASFKDVTIKKTIPAKREAFPSGEGLIDGTLDANRTRDLPFRKGSLYPTELRGHFHWPSETGKRAKSVLDYRVEGGAFQFFMAIEKGQVD